MMSSLAVMMRIARAARAHARHLRSSVPPQPRSRRHIFRARQLGCVNTVLALLCVLCQRHKSPPAIVTDALGLGQHRHAAAQT